MEWSLLVLTLLLWAVGICLTLWGGYYLLTGLLFWRRGETYRAHPAETRFAILVAARNEALVIGPLVRSLQAQDYPKESYDIWVIPNHCTDRTAAEARAAGAKVLDCTVPVHSKGEVLRFAYHQLQGRGYDAYCVFDADNVVDRRFLSEMNNAYQSGVRVAQGYRDSKNPYDTAISGCYSIYYWMMDCFHNGSRAGLGLSAMVTGTGFMVSAQTLERLGGWCTQTISEDLEITAQCVLAGERVHWVPKAITYDEQPLDYAQSVTQRKRWSSGTLQVAEQYLGRTGQALATAKRPLALVDLGATLLIPMYQVAALAGTVAASLSACGDCRTLAQALVLFLTTLVGNLALTALGTTAAAWLVLLVEGKWDRRLWRSLLLYWLFLLSWLPITLSSLVKKTTVWEETKHIRTVLPEQI
jgi:cellulose synthase/poly-beta-1,6-N-acetylglucosamine synthase-like glycosyltransferase